MNSVKWWTCHGVYLQNISTCIQSQMASSSSVKRNWNTYNFIHFVKGQKLGSQKVKDIMFVHSNLHLVSLRGEEYTSGCHRDWDVDAKA